MVVSRGPQREIKPRLAENLRSTPNMQRPCAIRRLSRILIVFCIALGIAAILKNTALLPLSFVYSKTQIKKPQVKTNTGLFELDYQGFSIFI